MDELLNGLNNNKEEEEILSQFDIKATKKNSAFLIHQANIQKNLKNLTNVLKLYNQQHPIQKDLSQQ